MLDRIRGFIGAGGRTMRAIDLDFGIEHMLQRCRARGCAINTLKAYGADLADLQGYLAQHGITLLGLIADRHVEGWLDDNAARGLSSRSIARKLCAFRKLVRHARTEGWITHSPGAEARVSFRTKRVIAPEMDALVAMINRIAPIGPVAKRDRAMLSLALDAGLRVGAVATLDVPGTEPTPQFTVDLAREMVHVPAKGGGTHTVCIDTTTARRIEAWIDARSRLPRIQSTALFLTQRGTRFTRQSLNALINRRAVDAGLDGVHFHLLRHRRIGDLKERFGTPVAQVHAGHAHPSTTENVYGAHTSQVLHQRIREGGAVPWGAPA